MNPLNANKTGLVFGLLLGGWHTLWAALVAFGWAQSVLNFAFWMHFIKPIYVIDEFHIKIAVGLVALTATVGYALGFIGASIWNTIHRPA
jgi:hypothetical protein